MGITLLLCSVRGDNMKKQNESIAFMMWTITSLVLLALFLYAIQHEGPTQYWQSGRRITPISDLLGAAFLFSTVSLLFRLARKK